MPIVGAPTHLAPRDDVDPRQLLVEHRGLHGPVLRVQHGAHVQLAHCDQAIEGLEPVGNAMGADDRRLVFQETAH